MQKKLRIGDYELTISGAVDVTGATENDMRAWGYSDEQAELQVLSDAMVELHNIMLMAKIHAKQKHGKESLAVQRIAERMESVRTLLCEADQIFE